jgi:transcriptional regulator with GAF, ATPase, and Fis domain
MFIGFVLLIAFGLTQSEDFTIRQLDALWVALVLSGVAAFEWTVLSTGVISLVIFLIGQQEYGTFDIDSSAVLGGIFLLTLFGWLATDSLRRTVRAATVEAEQRTRLLETNSIVTQNIFSNIELGALLDQTVETIRRQFETVYHAQVFLIDKTGREAVLRASTGEIGQQLIERGHRLGVGSQSVIGQVAQRGEPVLASNTSVDAVHRRNELLPNTLTELALPLQVTEGILGALDLQSLQANAFSPSDIEVFQLLADQIALAIENARLLADLETQLHRNEELLVREQENRQQIEQLNRELLGQGWATYLQTARPPLAQSIDVQSGELASRAKSPTRWSSQALQTGDVDVRQDENGREMVVVPIRVEDTTIGVIEFELPAGETVSPGIVDALQTLRSRLGIIAENVRLFDQARSIASREQVVGNVAERLQQSRDLQSLLTQAAPLFNDILNAQNTRIRLGQPSGGNGQSENSQQTAGSEQGNGHQA